MFEPVVPRKTKNASSSLTAPAPSKIPFANGQSLTTKTQQTMSSQFGHDFSRVRIHTDSQAASSARELNAKAYTVGTEIVFREGQYAPGSHDGDRLLAHELTHVVQNTQGGRAAGGVSCPEDGAEQEADALSERAARGGAVAVNAAPSALVARAFWNGNDPENDFWGTKELLEPKWGGVADAASATAWDGIGMIPGIGPAASGAVDLAKTSLAGATGEYMNMEGGARDFFGMGGGTASRIEGEKWMNASSHFMHDTEMDAVGAIPGVGTAIGGASLLNDGKETWNRMMGDGPGLLSGDVSHKTLGDIGL